MLQSIRERSQGWLAWTIIILISITFVLWGADAYFGSSGTTVTVAKVNGEEITQNEFNATFNRLVSQQRQIEGADFVLTAELEQSLKETALNELIKQHILIQAVEKAGFVVPEVQLQAALTSLLQQDDVTPENFQALLAQLLNVDPQFLDKLRKDLLLNQLRIGLVGSDFALPHEVEQAVKLIAQERDITYTIIPAQRFANKIAISEEGMSFYYQRNKAQFTTPEKVKLQYVELDLDTLIAQIEPSQEEIEAYYEANQPSYTRPPQWQAAELLIALPKNATPEETQVIREKANELAKQAQAEPEHFNELVQAHTDDRLAAKKGGLLDWFSANEVESNIAEALAQLQQPKQVTDPILTEKGFVILQLLDTRPPQIQPLEAVAENIKLQIARQQAEQEFLAIGERVMELAFEQPDSLKPIANELGLEIKETDWVSNYLELPESLAQPKVFSAALSEEVLHYRHNSDVIELTPEHWVALRVKEHQPTREQSFDEVKEEIHEELQQKAQEDQATELGQSILEDWQAGIDLNALSDTHSVAWQQANDLTRYNEELPAEILNKAFTLPLHTMEGTALANGDYALILVDAINYPDPNEFDAEDWQVYNTEVADSYGQLSYSSYTQALEKNAKVEKTLANSGQDHLNSIN